MDERKVGANQKYVPYTYNTYIKTWLTVVHTNARPTLIVRGSLRLSVCKGSSSSSDGSGRRNNGRRDCSNDRKWQRVAMNNGMEERLLIMSCGGDGLLYCRRNGYGWHRGWQQTSPWIPLGLDIVASSVPLVPFDKFGGLGLVVTWIFLCYYWSYVVYWEATSQMTPRASHSLLDCVFLGLDRQTHLIVLAFCVCIKILYKPQLWSKDHASTMIFEHDNKGLLQTPTWSDNCWENISSCESKLILNKITATQPLHTTSKPKTPHDREDTGSPTHTCFILLK